MVFHTINSHRNSFINPINFTLERLLFRKEYGAAEIKWPILVKKIKSGTGPSASIKILCINFLYSKVTLEYRKRKSQLFNIKKVKLQESYLTIM